jgi:hypothetical protein
MLALTVDDPRVGSVVDGKRIYPTLMVNGAPFDRGGGYTTLPLGGGYWVVVPGGWTEPIVLETKPEPIKESRIGRPKRQSSDIGTDSTEPDYIERE